jgi:hypothetical protein
MDEDEQVVYARPQHGVAPVRRFRTLDGGAGEKMAAIFLDDESVIVVNGEQVCLYPSIEAFWQNFETGDKCIGSILRPKEQDQ